MPTTTSISADRGALQHGLAFFWMLPPFYCLQLHPETRKRQLELWASLFVALAEAYSESTTDDGRNDADDDDDPLVRRSPVAVNVSPKSELFHNPLINRRMPEDDAVLVLEHAAESSFFAGRQVFPYADSSGRVMILAFDAMQFAARLSRWAAAQATLGEDGISASVHTIAEILEEPDLFPRAASSSSSGGGDIRRSPLFDRALHSLQTEGTVTEGDLLCALLHSDDFLATLRATPILGATLDGRATSLRGIKIAQ